MSGRDDDLFDVDDLRAAGGRAANELRERPVVVGVALAVVAVCVAVALVPHVLGAVGADAVDTGSGPTPDPESTDGARQRYQNYLTNVTFLFAPTLLPVVAVGVAFAGAIRVRGRRRTRVGSVVVGASVGMAIGYLAFVAVGHLAYSEAAEGYIVEEFPVSLRLGAVAVNALALAAVTAVGSAVVGVAGTLVEPDPGRGRVATAVGASDPRRGEVGEAVGAADADDAAAAEGATVGNDDDDSGGADRSRERPERVRADDADGDGSGPASDYRDTGPQRRGGSRTPTYDPDGRNWDGTDDGD
ncbi:hypothetical protein [Halorubellus sp. PRR65]|uniref:hypothetical protein n=1 Tax=Halorubellus sp. PRR65 TaxID=3098148 RepID=UPI002B2574A5|nr:hypothetical protein [Halorubellus sp. PRR65]